MNYCEHYLQTKQLTGQHAYKLVLAQEDNAIIWSQLEAYPAYPALPDSEASQATIMRL
jgi:hypothetical protein